MKGSQKLMDRIKEDKIQPIPRWRFLLRNVLLWTGFGLWILLGALAFSVILFSIQQTEFSMLAHLSHSRQELVLALLPVFWIVLLLIALGIAAYSIQYAPRSYKLGTARWVAFSSLFSILLGTLFFMVGGAKRLEHTFAVEMNLTESIQEKKKILWSQPEQGYLSGTILDASGTVLQLRDFSQKTWTIPYEGAFIPPVVLLEPGEIVKLIGTMQSANQFKASEIRPWGGPGQRMRRHGQ